MANTISNMDDTIDSRDVIERMEELQCALQHLYIDQRKPMANWDSENMTQAEVEDAEELRALLALQIERMEHLYHEPRDEGALVGEVDGGFVYQAH